MTTQANEIYQAECFEQLLRAIRHETKKAAEEQKGRYLKASDDSVIQELLFENIINNVVKNSHIKASPIMTQLDRATGAILIEIIESWGVESCNTRS